METLRCFIILLVIFCKAGFCEIYKYSYGNDVEIKKTPERIIAIGPAAARIVAYLGEVKKLIATENIELKYPQGRPYT